MADKVISIAIATYNMEEYLSRCLDSLLIDSSLLQYVEVLVINDGSKDRSLAIAREYESKYPGVFRVIDKENGNYGSCINKAMDEAKGLYFKILDADDWYNTQAFESLVRVLIESDGSIDVYFNNFTYNNFYQNTETHYRYSNVEYSTVYDMTNLDIADTDDLFLLKMYSMTYRTQLLRDLSLRLDTGISFTDNEYVYIPITKVCMVMFLDLDIYQYFIGREGQTVDVVVTDRQVDNLYTVSVRLADYYNDSICGKVSPSLERICAFLLARVSLDHINRALMLKKSDKTQEQIKTLYSKVKNHGLVISRMRRESPYFRIWERTGLYKSNPVVNKFYNLFNKVFR